VPRSSVASAAWRNEQGRWAEGPGSNMLTLGSLSTPRQKEEVGLGFSAGARVLPGLSYTL
jgi:hypothetical protein